jgi:hypothetical protein
MAVVYPDAQGFGVALNVRKEHRRDNDQHYRDVHETKNNGCGARSATA